VAARILAGFRREQERLDDERKVAKILLATGAPMPEAEKGAPGRTAAGDPRRLRGIPRSSAR
jgi:hypothetical protein